MARLAARLGAGLSADSTGMALEGDKLVATRPIYAGKLLSKMTWAKTPWMATLRPNVFRPAESRPASPPRGPSPPATPRDGTRWAGASPSTARSEEHTSELQSHLNLLCRLLLVNK